MAADQEQIGGGFAPGGVRGVADAPSVERAGAAAQDADVDQPNREHVFVGPAQRAEYQAFTRQCHAQAVAGDGVAVLRETVCDRLGNGGIAGCVVPVVPIGLV